MGEYLVFGIVLPHFIEYGHQFLDSMKQFMKSCHYVGTNRIIFGVFVFCLAWIIIIIDGFVCYIPTII